MVQTNEQPRQVAADEQPPGRVALVVVRWATTKIHVTADGVKTVCGALVPAQARRTIPTVDWHLHTNCYNCAYRLWPQHGPADYLRPASSEDFPVQRRCPHGGRARYCVKCTPSAPQNWPCRNGCTDPADHDPGHRYTKCTVFPPHRPPATDGRCTDGCESTEIAMHRANPGMSFDLADSAAMYCYHCGEPVCVGCQTAPVEGLCDRCAAP